MKRVSSTLACLLILAACDTLPQNVDVAHKAIKSARQAMTIHMDDKCLDALKKCKEGGIVTSAADKKNCDAWVTCDEQRHAWYKGFKAMQLTLLHALSFYVVGEDEAKTWYERAILQFRSILNDLKQHGVLP